MMTKIREGYKETEIGVIPEEWNVDSFENICVPKGMVRGPFGGALKKEFFVQSGYKVYEQKNAINKDAFIGEYYINQEKFEELKRFEVKSKDFIVSCSGTIGKIYQIPENHGKGIINQALLKITTNPNIINDLFFYNYFEWDNFQRKIIDNTQGGAMKNLVGMDIIKKTPFSVPPLPEQQRIAEILSTTHSHIEKLDKTIEDYQLLKKGMMKKLLTEGVGHTEFKETEIGRIPKAWKVTRICDVSSFISNGFVGTASPYYSEDENATLYLMGNNVRENYIDKKTLIRINDEFTEKYPKSKLFKGDMLTVQSGHIGTSCIVTEEFDNAHCHAVIITRFDKTKVNPDFQAYYLNSSEGKSRLKSLFVGTTIKHINTKDLKVFCIPLPTLIEQQSIAEILSTIDKKVDMLQNQRQDFSQVKKFLMEKLLTGKVRVI